MSGDFKLDSYLGPTFYTQGVIGAVFSFIFGIGRLPVLTLFFSIMSLFIVFNILHRFQKFSILDSIITGLMFYFIPLNVYSLWGFMTEEYLLFFYLVILYFFLRFDESRKSSDFLLMYIFIFLAFFLKQNSFVFPFSISLYYFYKRNIKLGAYNFLAFFIIFVYYFLFFPKTDAMIGKSLALNHLFEPNYIYAIVYGILLMSTAFLIPIFFSSIEVGKLSKKSTLIAFVLIGIILFIFLNRFYKPSEVSWGEFPYFENTFERTGFYPRGIHGTKYQFTGIYDLYKYWDLAAKVLLSSLIALSIVTRKIKVNYFLFFILTFLAMSIATERYFDRYTLMILPFVLFYLSEGIKFNLLKRVSVVIFSIFLIFYGYQFSMDFISVNKYVWGRSKTLVETGKANENELLSTNSWKLMYKSNKAISKYIFSYDSTKVNEEFRCCYELIESKEITYPFNFFINPEIYLYRKL